MEPWIKINQVKKTVDDFQLGPIHLDIEPGTITALVGNNGSGKSTLLKLIMNLVKPDTGDIKVFNQLVVGEDESWKQHIAYQAQTATGYDVFTGKTLKDLISHWYPTWDEERFQRLVDLFQISLNKRYGKMSQGAQQKLRLALTIATNARILILDEPTSFIDIPSKNKLIDLLVEWMDEGERAIVMASHQAEDINKLADYITVLHNGQLLGTYEKEELTASYQQYWIKEDLPPMSIPGEVTRNNNRIISNEADLTEQFFQHYQISWTDRKSLELEEVITLLLTKEGNRIK